MEIVHFACKKKFKISINSFIILYERNIFIKLKLNLDLWKLNNIILKKTFLIQIV